MKSNEELLRKAGKIFSNESKLVKLPRQGFAVFVGDTHGDFDATKKVIERYMKKDTIIVFLGDYIDRGTRSRENIEYLLKMKIKNPDDLILLMGNHEGFKEISFYPADFWEGLSKEDIKLYGETLIKLPLAVHAPNGLIALHGALPDVQRIEEINKIQVKPKDKAWFAVVWGDFKDQRGKGIGKDFITGRPQFGRDYFECAMKRLGKRVLIRSHDPGAETVMYDKRCLTIFTSHAYKPERTVAVADLGKKIKTTDDLKIEEI